MRLDEPGEKKHNSMKDGAGLHQNGKTERKQTSKNEDGSLFKVLQPAVSLVARGGGQSYEPAERAIEWCAKAKDKSRKDFQRSQGKKALRGYEANPPVTRDLPGEEQKGSIISTWE